MVYNQSLSGREIRLIEILPGASLPLEISLQRADLQHRPIFNALSYCWGDETSTEPIKCNGRDFKVTRNLWLALRELRGQFADESVRLWVDAVCINQHNTKEKNHQVAMMDQIYRSASVVYIWLGDDDAPEKEGEKGLKLLRDMQLVFAENNFESAKDINYTSTDGKLPPIADTRWLCLLRLLQRPWFHRLWIIQEITLARQAVVCCGSSRCPWETVFEVLSSDIWQELVAHLIFHHEFRDPSVLDRHLAANILYLMQTKQEFLKRQEAGEGMELLSLAHRHRHAYANDARDKIFGLLGLINVASNQNAGPRIMVPDYDKSLREVYVGFARACLTATDYLDLLSVTGASKQVQVQDLQLPSWIPDWRVREGYAMSYLLDTDARPLLRACGDSTTKNSLEIVDDSLIIQGYVFDEIVATGATLDTYDIYRDSQDVGSSSILARLAPISATMAVLYDWQKICQCKRGKPYPTGEDSFQTFIHVMYPRLEEDRDEDEHLATGRMFDLARHVGRWVYLLWLLRVHRLSRRLYSLITVVLVVIVTIFKRNVIAAGGSSIAPFARMRRMARTKRSYYAMAPASVGKGDVVVLARGSRTPLVLRKPSLISTEYKLIGDAYVPGLMEGEAFNDTKCGPITIT